MNENPTLYELTGKYLELEQLAQTAETEEDMQVFRDTFESLDATINDKMEGCCQVIRELEGKITVLSDEIGRLSTRKKTIQNSIDNLKMYMKKNMEQLGMDKVDTGLFNVTIAKNGGKRKLNVLVAPELLPQQFQTIKIEANNEALRKAMVDMKDMSADYDVMQVHDADNNCIAELEPQGTSLRIR